MKSSLRPRVRVAATRRRAALGFAVMAGCVVGVVGAIPADAVVIKSPAETEVVVWGTNTDAKSVPSNLGDVVAIAAGYAHVLALRTDGTVVGWGRDLDGDTRPPSDLRRVSAIAAGPSYSLALLADGTVRSWGHGAPAVPESLSSVVAIAAGSYHALALLADGTVRAFGQTAYGRLQPPPGLHDVIAVAAGEDQSFALRSDGSVVGWGVSDQLMMMPREPFAPSTPTAADETFFAAQNTGHALGPERTIGLATRATHTLELRSDGTVSAYGRPDFAASAVPSSVAALHDIKAVATGVQHNIALRANGTVVSWGAGGPALLRAPKQVRHALAVCAGYAFSVALIRR